MRPALTVWPDGRLAELKGLKTTKKRVYVPRGRVGRFTKVHRLRMLRTIARVRDDVPLPLFVGLTYPDRYPTPEQAKRDLREWHRRMARVYAGLAGVWRLEFQERGAPHFHLILWNVVYMPWQLAARVWTEVVGGYATEEEREHHYKHCSEVQRARSARGAGAYAAKYCAKVKPEAGPEFCGRRWGLLAGSRVPWSATKKYYVPMARFHDVRRAMARAARRSLKGAPGGRGLTVFAGAPDVFARLL